jgi:hypothetical protein
MLGLIGVKPDESFQEGGEAIPDQGQAWAVLERRMLRYQAPPP